MCRRLKERKREVRVTKKVAPLMLCVKLRQVSYPSYAQHDLL